MPTSSARRTTARVAASSQRPPKLLQPSPTEETIRPERPRLRCSTLLLLRDNGCRQPPQYIPTAADNDPAGVCVSLGFDPFWVAIVVFALTYVLVIADRINRSIIALLGAGTMVVSGVLTQDE